MTGFSHLGARLHRFIYSGFYRSDRKEAIYLHERVQTLLDENEIATPADRKRLIAYITDTVADTLELKAPRRDEVAQFVTRLFDYETLFDPPPLDFDTFRTVTEVWNLREILAWHKRQLDNFPDVIDALIAFVHDSFKALDQANEITGSDNPDGIIVTAQRFASIAGLGEVVEQMTRAAFAPAIEKHDQLTHLRERLEINLVIASGGNPRDIEGFNKAYRQPSKYDAKKPKELLDSYLHGTPLLDLFEGEREITIPTSTRFEHHHIVAGSGHGKTQTLQYLIAKDLDAVGRGERSIVVIDSQGDLINTIASLKLFAPGQPLHDRICIIDPSDVEYPVSLNLFDIGQDRLTGYELLERERLTNSILELYDFVLGSLLSAEMTQKQNVIFRYVTRLMLHIPDATIHTLRELMEPGSDVKFAEHIAKLDGTARHFFETEFNSREFEQTKKQVLRRLWGILENRTFERMFSHPRSKLDLFSEMNAGKVILINTAKDLLKETGTEIFGRFFIAMIAQAAQERAVLPEAKRMPTFVYVDEAAEYFDRNIGIILSQARKFKVGMVLAHQYMGQLDTKLQDAFSANTAIKFAGGFTGREARQAATMLGCDASLIEAQPKGAFAAFIRGLTKAAIPLRFPLGAMEALPQMNSNERGDLKENMRSKYAVHHSQLNPDMGVKDGLASADNPSSDMDRKPDKDSTDIDHPNTDPSSEW